MIATVVEFFLVVGVLLCTVSCRSSRLSALEDIWGLRAPCSTSASLGSGRTLVQLQLKEQICPAIRDPYHPYYCVCLRLSFAPYCGIQCGSPLSDLL